LTEDKVLLQMAQLIQVQILLVWPQNLSIQVTLLQIANRMRLQLMCLPLLHWIRYLLLNQLLSQYQLLIQSQKQCLLLPMLEQAKELRQLQNQLWLRVLRNLLLRQNR
jgi:hypothetical protein